MSDNQELMDILNSEYDRVFEERMAIEMNDFSKMEEHWSKTDPVMESSAQLWYLSLNESDDDVPTINDEHGDAVTLSVKFKGTYPNVFDALIDSDSIRQCKEDNCVGIITRSESLMPKTKAVCYLTTLTTPSGVHMISRNGEEIYTSSTPRHKVKANENRLVDELIEACFTW